MSDPLEGILTVAGPSGGAGRTTLTLGVGATLAQSGFDVLLVDLDPRGSLTYLSGIGEQGRQSGLLRGLSLEADQEPTILPTGYPGLYVLPSDTVSMSEHWQLEAALADWRMLPKLLIPLLDRFQTIVIDAPAGAGRMARSGINIADYVLLTLPADPLAVRTLPDVLEAVVDAREIRRSGVELAGIVLNRVDPSVPLFRQVVDNLFERFQPHMLETAIPSDPWFVEAAARAMPLSYLLPESAGALAISRLTDELRRRLR